MSPLHRVRSYLLPGILLLAILFGLGETLLQVQDYLYVRSVALSVVQEARAETPRERVVALRDYVRRSVTMRGAPYDDRPFFRASAGETLRSGKGYCGEDSRAFICLAGALDIPAQRINLTGKKQHVVAEAELGPNDKVIVDCQKPPQIDDLEPLDRIMNRPDYDDFSTVNLRRLHISWLVTRLKLSSGFVSYWLENPHALKALLWFALPVAALLLKGGRVLLRRGLRWRGWVHSSSLPMPPDSLKSRSPILQGKLVPPIL